jgi:glycosyl transferase family 25
MQILVINLDRAPERLHRMEALLSDLHLPFERVTAVDGWAMDESELSRWVQEPGHFYRLGGGEIGCFLSHRTCWEIAARGKPGEYIVVLEDDVLLGKQAETILARDDWIPADADMVKLETILCRTRTGRPERRATSTRNMVRLQGAHAGAGGYAVSPKAAAMLLRMSETFHDPVDQFLFNPLSPAFHAMVIYQLTPAICIQGSVANPLSPDMLRSTLDEERRQRRQNIGSRRRKTFTAKLRRELARPFRQAATQLRHWTGQQTTGCIPFE